MGNFEERMGCATEILIDIENWARKEFYEHFIHEVVCTYSAVVNVDITNLKGQKLYPAMIWLLQKSSTIYRNFAPASHRRDLASMTICTPCIQRSIDTMQR